MKDVQTKIQALRTYIDGLKGRLSQSPEGQKKKWLQREIDMHEKKISYLSGK